MSIHVSFTEQSQTLFAERIEQMDATSSWGRLPPLSIAMHPSHVSFSDDLSDSTFNDRFIESRVTEGEGASVLYMIAGWHNMLFLSLVFGCVYYRAIVWPILLIYIVFGLGFCLNSVRIVIKLTRLGSGRVRFNRQAQLVHFLGGKNYDETISLPWRNFIALTEFVGASMGGGNLLKFLAPTPEGIDDGGKCIELRGAITSGDGSFYTNLRRLEFLRRYMAHGLEALQPDPELVASGFVHKPSGYEPDYTFEQLGFSIIFQWGLRIMYYAGGGPLIDRWMKRAADNYRWPEEVERLCAEGADLTGIDTTPVAAHDNLFYRYGGMGNPIQYVDAQDRELH